MIDNFENRKYLQFNQVQILTYNYTQIETICTVPTLSGNQKGKRNWKKIKKFQ